MKPEDRIKEPLVHSLRTRLIAIAGAAAVAGISASLFLSAPSQISAQPDAVGTPPNREGRRQASPGQDKQQHDEMRARVAANLGITSERLAEAFAQARKDLITEMVQQGKITQEQADKRIARIGQGPKPARTEGGKPKAPVQRDARIGGPQVRAIGGVVAQALGLNGKDLRDALNNGKTLAQLAQEKGLSVDQLRSTVSQQLEQRLNAAIQAGSLTDEQAAQIRARHQQAIERHDERSDSARSRKGKAGAVVSNDFGPRGGPK